jgi:hypothetical protein
MKNLVLAVALLALLTHQASADVILHLTDQQMVWLGQALQELPKRLADPFIADLNKQLADQQPKPMAKKIEEDKKGTKK